VVVKTLTIDDKMWVSLIKLIIARLLMHPNDSLTEWTMKSFSCISHKLVNSKRMCFTVSGSHILNSVKIRHFWISTSASEVTTIWCYTNVYIIINIIKRCTFFAGRGPE